LAANWIEAFHQLEDLVINAQGTGKIDLVIDRRDGIVNLCEMKYSNKEFVITRDYDDHLRKRREAFRQETKTRKSLHLTFVTTYGLSRKGYWSSAQSEVTMDDLFAE
jgi:hypothetical protein